MKGVLGAIGGDLDDIAGGGSRRSLVVAVLEGALVVAAPLWLLEVFRRRFAHQGRVARECARGAFAAFVVHQVVLVGLVLGRWAWTVPSGVAGSSRGRSAGR